MTYEETCSCGAKVKLETEQSTELARVKSQWKIDHGPHGDNTITIERKRALLEYNDLRARVKTAEDKAYPAMVLAYDMVIVGDKNKIMYRGTLHPGNGFQWDDPNSSFQVLIQPTMMKLPDIEDKEEVEALQVEAARRAHPDDVTAAKALLQDLEKMSRLSKTTDATGERPPPAGSVLNRLSGVSPEEEFKKRFKKTSTEVIRQAKQMDEELFQRFKKANPRIMYDPRPAVEDEYKKVADEQGQPGESERDDGAAKTEKVVTRSRIRRGDGGRRGDK